MGEKYKEQYVEVELNSNTIKYYGDLGYEIPKIYKNNKLITPKGTKIYVKENDLINKKLIGNIYGKLTVVDYDEARSDESYKKKLYYKYWLCKCNCGNENLISVNQMNLLTRKSTSCGCMFKKKITDLTGNIYGRLTVIKPDEIKNKDSDKTYWLCKCNCGNTDLVSIESNSLKIGYTQSCGCLWKEAISGENSHYWQGGITNLYQHLRNKIEPWTIDTFIKYDRKCIITNKSAEVIHHLINFSDIVKEVLNELNLPVYNNVNDYSTKALSSIDDLVLKKHFYYDCGVPLRKDMHILFHNIYGYKNNTIDQFVDYTNKIFNGTIEIPYWTEKDESYKILIDNKINEILNKLHKVS